MPFTRLPPKKIFLIDSLGALLSALLLGVVLVRFEPVFGMPPNVLYVLASIACLFAIHSFICYVGNGRPATRLKVIGFANLLYCCLTACLVFFFYQELTVFGITYFVLEMIVVTVLAVFELKTAVLLTKASVHNERRL